MKFNPPLQQGVLIKRYKRFLTDIIDDKNETLTIHCPNTGSMKNCAEPGSAVYYSTSDNPKRKYPNTWEIVSSGPDILIGINTIKANSLVREGIDNGIVKELQGFDQIETEVKYGEENSRIDLLLSNKDLSANGDQATQLWTQSCYVEVKNLTLLLVDPADEGGTEPTINKQGFGVFPDAITTRGHKHLRELIRIKQAGHRAVLFFCVQHTGIKQVAPADDIDPVYGKLLREAAGVGVEVLAYGCDITPKEISLRRALPVVLDGL